MRRTRLIAFTLTAIMVLGATACNGGSNDSNIHGGNGEDQAALNDSEDVLELKAGHVLTEDSPYHLALTQWADEVYEKTEGRVKIDVFANSVLGNERDMIEALQIGTLDITLPNSAPLGNFTDALKVFDLPFLFMEPEEAYMVIDSEIGDNMLEALDEIGLVGLSMWENGFRHIANNKGEVKTPDDLRGMKVRTMEAPIHMAAFRAWGADATSMAFGEVYTALQQKTVDGLENPFTPIYQNKLYEVAPYITMTGHFYCPAPLLISKTTWNKISPDDQKVIRELSDKYKEVERQLCMETDEEYKRKMIEEGAVVVEDIDKTIWREAALLVYDEYTEEIGGELLKQIQEILAE